MNFKLSALLFIGILFMHFTSDDPVAKDVVNYVNVELPKVADLESTAVDAYNSVSGANYTSDAVMSAKLTSVAIPKYQEFYNKLKAIKPATKDLQKVHQEYVEAAKDQLEAFNFVVDAIKKGDAAEIQKANGDFKKASDLIDKWKTDLTALYKKHSGK